MNNKLLKIQEMLYDEMKRLSDLISILLHSHSVITMCEFVG